MHSVNNHHLQAVSIQNVIISLDHSNFPHDTTTCALGISALEPDTFSIRQILVNPEFPEYIYTSGYFIIVQSKNFNISKFNVMNLILENGELRPMNRSTNFYLEKIEFFDDEYVITNYTTEGEITLIHVNKKSKHPLSLLVLAP